MKKLIPAHKKFITTLILSFSMSLFFAGKTLALTGNVGVHDPSGIVKCEGKYYVFTTGGELG